MTKSIREQSVSGTKWTTLSTVIVSIAALLRVSILARYLDSADFGLMALVVFSLGFTNLFMDMGLTSAILHKQNISKNEYSSLFWLNVGFSFLLFCVLYFISPFVASFYNELELSNLIPLMALSLIISSFGRQFKTILQKEFKFKTIAIVDSISAVFSLALAVHLAVNNYGVYSLVYSSLLQYVVSNVILLFIGLKTYGLKIHFRINETKPFLKIGIYQVGGQVINYFNRDIDLLILGKYFGSEILGGYSLAKQLVYRPAQVLNPIITKVASPILSTLQTDRLALKKNYLNLVSIVSTINIPIYILLVIFSPLAVLVFYGSGHENIIVLVRILSLYMLIRSIGNPIGSLIIATGRTDLEFKWNLFTLIVTPVFVLIGAQKSLELSAIMVTLSMIVLFIPSWWFLLRKTIDVTFKEYLLAIFKINKFWKKG